MTVSLRPAGRSTAPRSGFKLRPAGFRLRPAGRPTAPRWGFKLRWRRVLPVGHAAVGLGLIVVGEALILARARPLSDYYFPFVWLGYILLLDGTVHRQRGRSLLASARPVFLVMLPVSAAIWWLFELLNTVVHNWLYIGGEAYTGLSFVAVASLDFSFVLLSVWTSALYLDALLPPRWAVRRTDDAGPVPGWILLLMLAGGALCLLLPLIYPRYFFGLIWGSTYLLLDPINDRMGRPAIIAEVWRGRWRTALTFALAGLMCGFFWEAWNYWSMPKWVYTLPYVNHWRIFEMPLLGWLGYLPFGLELFAMTNFVLPLLGLGTLTLELPQPADAEEPPAATRRSRSA